MEIIITITPEGKRVFEVVGMQGPGCQNLLDFVKGLGEVESEEHTADYYREPDDEQGIVRQVTARG